MKDLTVVSYNIHHGADASLDMNVIAKCIKSVDADIVGIQEIDVGTKRLSGRDTLKELKEALGFEYARFVKCIDYQGGEYGIAQLSKFPIVEFKQKLLYHTTGCEQRGVGVAKINADGHIFTFANTHLDLPSDDIRRKQLAEINELLKGNEPFILTGDFNSESFSIFSEIENATPLLTSKNKLVTFPGAQITIDNIICHNDIIHTSVSTLKESFSDHYMLYAKIKLA